MRSGLDFWFDPNASEAPINYAATAVLSQLSELAAKAVPILRGTVIITGRRGDKPAALSPEENATLAELPKLKLRQLFTLAQRVTNDRLKRRLRELVSATR